MNSETHQHPVRRGLRQPVLALIVLQAIIQTASAQFTYTNNDLIVGFRKTGVNQESFESVVNIGKAINYVHLAPGTTTNIPSFSLSQLTPDSFSSVNNLNWSVFGYSKTNNIFQLPGYPNNVLWLTVPRANTNTQTAPPTRQFFSAQGTAGGKMNSIGGGGVFLSSQTSAGADNTASFIREANDPTYGLTAFMKAVGDNTASTLNDKWTGNNLEITTPASFNAGVVSDLYEVCPDGFSSPNSQPTSGDAYYVGYFRLNPNGTMSFTRAAAASPAPPAPTLTILRSGNTSTIYFGTTNGATYSLRYTNASGLLAPVANWPASVTTVPGDGSTHFFTDTTTDTNRFYRVRVQ